MIPSLQQKTLKRYISPRVYSRTVIISNLLNNYKFWWITLKKCAHVETIWPNFFWSLFTTDCQCKNLYQFDAWFRPCPRCFSNHLTQAQKPFLLSQNMWLFGYSDIWMTSRLPKGHGIIHHARQEIEISFLCIVIIIHAV